MGMIDMPIKVPTVPLLRTIAKYLFVTLSGDKKSLCSESGILRFTRNDRTPRRLLRQRDCHASFEMTRRREWARLDSRDSKNERIVLTDHLGG